MKCPAVPPIVPFRPELADAFRSLNRAWIEQLFVIEGNDLKFLNDPEGAIVAPGGQIFFALDGANAVGTVAAVLVGPRRYELAKMAVAPSHQRRGLGWLLGAAVVDYAASMGAETLFLVTNSQLLSAIRLYERLGFRHATAPTPTGYARADVYMEIDFSNRE